MFHERRLITAIVTVLAAACAASSPVQATPPSSLPGVAMSDVDTLVLQPGSEGVDTYVYSLQPTANFGTVAWLHATGLPYAEAFVRFDLSSILPGSTIVSAEIELWGEYRDGTLTFAPVASTWDEAVVTWNTKPGSTVPEVTHPIDTCASGCSKKFEIADVVRYVVDHPQSECGTKITGNTPSIGWMLGSSDNPTPSRRPKLTVLYVAGGVPVAPAGWGGVKSTYR